MARDVSRNEGTLRDDVPARGSRLVQRRFHQSTADAVVGMRAVMRPSITRVPLGVS